MKTYFDRELTPYALFLASRTCVGCNGLKDRYASFCVNCRSILSSDFHEPLSKPIGPEYIQVFRNAILRIDAQKKAKCQ